MKRKCLKSIFVMPPLLCCAPFVTTSCAQDNNNQTYNVPKLTIYGDIGSLTKEEESKLSLKYEPCEGEPFEADILIKLQGASTTKKPKKNFNIKMYKKGTNFEKKLKLVMRENGDSDNKFTLKGNYTDSLSLHNIISARIGGDIVHQTQHVSQFQDLINGGAIDGFPFVCGNNDEILGLYTGNLKKNENLFHLDDTGHKAMISGSQTEPKDQEYLLFRKPISALDVNGWELEYSSDGETSGIVNSFNAFINAVISANDSTTFKTIINQHSDLLTLVDYFIYISFITAGDNVGNNMIGVTYDGTKGLPSFYDGDFTYGFQGERMYDPKFDFTSVTNKSVLGKKINLYCQDEIHSEYNILKNGALSYSNIKNKFDAGMEEQTEKGGKFDREKGKDRDLVHNTLDILEKWVEERIKYYLQ